MEDKRYYNNKANKPKYNEINYLISNYIKSELENKQELGKLVGNFSKIKSRFKKSDSKNNSPKINNLDSPSFGCKKTKSVDDINYRNSPNNISRNSNYTINNKKISYYKRPQNILHNKSYDNIKYTNNYIHNDRYVNTKTNTNDNISNYDNNTYSQNSFSNKNNSKFISPIYSLKYSPSLKNNNSFNNIFTKIPTNISRINKKNTNIIEYSFENSLVNYNNIYYQPMIYQNKKKVNKNYIGYNNTFYNEKNLSIEIANDKYNDNKFNINENISINNSTKNKNEGKENKKVYCRTPIIKNLLKLKKKFKRKKSEDYSTNKSIVTDLLHTENEKKDDNYFTNNSVSTNIQTNMNTINNYNINLGPKISPSKKYQKVVGNKVNKYKEYLDVFNSQFQINKNNHKNYSSIKANNNKNIKIKNSNN